MKFKLLGKINKNSLIIENENFESKIIFPDHKFSLNLEVGEKDLTIKSLLEKNAKVYSKEGIWSISFIDSKGDYIAQSINANLLSRLNLFQISLNGGERIYNCINYKYLGNNNINNQIKIYESEDFEAIFENMHKYGLNFSQSRQIIKDNKQTENQTTSNSLNPITYKHLFKDYIKYKYHAVTEFNKHLTERKERRIQKFLNLFFYISLVEVVAINLCTFVFFNWDVMEPITQCISYLNLITGYYFWAMTDTDYELDSMVSWMRKKRLFRNKLYDAALIEEEEIRNILIDKI